MSQRLDKILDICRENDLNFLDVMEIYTKFNSKVYARSVRKGEQFQLYNPVLEERTMKLTQRYFDIKKVKALKIKF
jgi:hypothetical protein